MRNTVSLEKAIKQHTIYCETLEELGLEIIHLPADDEHADSCFVEDNAVVGKGKALICRMGEKSREGEQREVARVLGEHMVVRWASTPATVEGGDIIHHERGLIAGLTQRTNAEGVKQLESWLNIPVETIIDTSIMHLKSYVTYLGKGIMIATNRYANNPLLSNYEIISPPRREEYAANTLAIGDSVLMPEGYDETHRMVRDRGFDVIPIKISEMMKCDGALTCLSIPF